MNLTLLHRVEAQLDKHRLSALGSPAYLETVLVLATLLKTYTPARTVALATEAAAMAQEHGIVVQEARAWSLRAYAEAQLELDEDAYQHGHRALALVADCEDPITVGYASLGIGHYLLNQFRYDEALAVGLNGYDLLRKAEDRSAQANITYIIMGAYSRLGNREQAETYGLGAVDLYRELGSGGGEVVQLNNLAMHFLWMEEYDSAWHFGQQALTLLRRLIATNTPFEFSYTTGAVMHTLAEIMLAHNALDEATAFLAEGLTFVKTTSLQTSPNDETFLLLALGKLHYTRNLLPNARQTLLTALWRAKCVGHRWLKAEIALVLTQVYEGMQQHRRALWYCRFYHAIDRARYQDQVAAKMQQLEKDYELKAAHREMAVLTEKNQQLEHAYAELQAAHTTIRQISMYDGLTQLYNRQCFEEWADACFEHSQQVQRPFTILLGDIDNFKQINDTFLHHTGDIVLQKVATELKSLCPSHGRAARYGGEEFVVAIPDDEYDSVYHLAEQIRQRIASYPWHSIHPTLQVTISIGIASNTHIDSLSQQLIQADRCLYRAKQAGKNQVYG